jgi:hypothetical protein
VRDCFAVIENSPCVDVGVDGFLPRVVNEVIDYLINGDVPSHVLKEDYDAYAGWRITSSKRPLMDTSII